MARARPGETVGRRCAESLFGADRIVTQYERFYEAC